MPNEVHGSAKGLDACEAVILIVYTVPPQAEERGYESWLSTKDNPFFNSIPGVWQYTNWRIDRILRGSVEGWSHFDFLGLRRRADLESVWFSPSLDEFRRGWVKLWATEQAKASELYGHAYLLERRGTAPRLPRDAATFSFGRGEPGAGATWDVTHAIRKHYVETMASRTGPWLIPAAGFNPLGLRWLSLGDAPEADLVFTGTRIAGPD